MIFQLYLPRLDVIESSTYLHIQKLVHALLHHSSVLGFFFLMWTIFLSLYWISYNIAPVLCFGFLAEGHVES